MEMLKKFYAEEDGMGTVELVMIIAALMCIALLFRDRITSLAKNIMDTVFGADNMGGVEKPSA
ncbi:MAG: Flp1 family type IVb pilin [Eubacteriales bacterium]|nr:Flp1 family type IVb pilin [Eubacteriales bacterium]